MLLQENFQNLLRCPVTGETLVRKDAVLESESGEHSYPLIDGVPWLLPHARNSLLDWGAKLHHFQQVLQSEAESLARDEKGASAATRQRLETLRRAKEAFLQEVIEIVSPIATAKVAQKSTYDALRDRAPSTQNLLSYESNLYRDWVWGEEENALCTKIVLEQFADTRPGRLLVLGAGSCRLAYDLHCALGPQMTAATDINPLLLLAANRIFSGGDFALHEFPEQPRTAADVAVAHRFSALEAWPEGFHLAFADAANPPFLPHAFNSVVTPWLIDIQPLKLGRFLRQLNQYLPVGGQWINFGSLVFNQRRDAHCYAIDEIGSIAEENGFRLGEPAETEIPYLRSPYNAGYRVERVWSWRAEKFEDVSAQPGAQVLPEWLLDAGQPIPSTRYLQEFSRQHRMYAEIVAEVNGKLSVRAIAGRFAKQNGMDRAEAEQMLRNFFLDLHRQNHNG